MDFDKSLAQAAAQRWEARRKSREANHTLVRAGRLTEAESADRVQKRLHRLERAAIQREVTEAVMATRRGVGLVETVGLERSSGVPTSWGSALWSWLSRCPDSSDGSMSGPVAPDRRVSGRDSWSPLDFS
jgi:hypothetical protein